MQDYEELTGRLRSLAEAADRKGLRHIAARIADLLEALSRREHDPNDVQEHLEELRRELADTPGARGLSKIRHALLSHLEKAHGLVPPGHYRSQWMAMGMAAFGLPMGAAFGVLFDNMAFIGMGLPIGLAIGLALGDGKDKEAARKGLQLEMPEE
jgi:hypothetical protein